MLTITISVRALLVALAVAAVAIAAVFATDALAGGSSDQIQGEPPTDGGFRWTIDTTPGLCGSTRPRTGITTSSWRRSRRWSGRRWTSTSYGVAGSPACRSIMDS